MRPFVPIGNIVYVLLVVLPLAGQTTNSTKLTASIPLRIVFPVTNDTVTVSIIRIAGSTDPAASLKINNRFTRVYPSGAFVSRIRLAPGSNKIFFSAQKNNIVTLDTLEIYRVPPILPSPGQPSEIDNRIMYPGKDMWLMDGDALEVRFKGSPGGKAQFHIDGIVDQIPMTELDSTEIDGLSGIYTGLVTIYASKPKPLTPVQFELKGMDGVTVKASSPGRVGILSGLVPSIAETIEETYLWNTAENGAILSTIPAGIRLHINGKIGDRYRVKLSRNKVAYVAPQNVNLLSAGTPLPRTGISFPTISYNGDWIRLSLVAATPCPFIVEQNLEPAEIELAVYGAHLDGQWTSYPLNEEIISMISWNEPESDVFKLNISLKLKQQWGYRVTYSKNQLNLDIRKPPYIDPTPEKIFKGLIFALDAGHGGEETGAIGATGLQEKDVNLTYTKYLASLLDSAGAQVIMVRKDDRTMSLQERMDIARKANAHFFLWLHNNSIGISSDAAAVRGTSTYFTIPQNQALAWKVYPHLLELELEPFGRIYSTYYITRQTDMLVVLVEGAFLSNPLDEMLLMKNDFLNQLARAVFNGIKNFLQSTSQNQTELK